jgi:hypothetical protein
MAKIKKNDVTWNGWSWGFKEFSKAKGNIVVAIFHHCIPKKQRIFSDAL